MARPRKRPDWIQKVYQYGVMTNEGIPREWQDEHAKRCRTWNALLAIRNEHKPEYDAIFAAQADINDLSEQIAALKASSDTIWQQILQQRIIDRAKNSPAISKLREQKRKLDDQKDTLAKERKAKKDLFKEVNKPQLEEYYAKLDEAYAPVLEGSDLYWANRQLLIDSFKHACRLPTVSMKSIMQQDLMFGHIYSGGGMPLKSLFNRNSRCYIENVNWDAIDTSLPQRQWKKLARTKVHFIVKGVEKVFSCVLHRPLPEDSVVKRVQLCGRRIHGRKIKWSISVTVEVPGVKQFRVSTRSTATINTNWRVTEDGLRIAALLDSTGTEELITLPAQEEASLRLPSNDVLKSVSYRKEMDTRIAAFINHLREYTLDQKKHIIDIDPSLFVNMHVANRKRFFQIAKACANQGHNEQADYIYNTLRKQDYFINRLANHRRRTRIRRKHFYYNLAHELCIKYHTIVLDNSDIKELGMPNKRDEKGEDPAELAQKFRAEAAIGEFRMILKQVAAKYEDTQILFENAAWISRLHFGCGHQQSEPTDKLLITCEKCGTVYDRDINAVRNLMSQYVGAGNIN